VRRLVCAVAVLLLPSPAAWAGPSGADEDASSSRSEPPASPVLPVLVELPAIRLPGDDAPWPPSGIVDVELTVEVAEDGTVLAVESPDAVAIEFARPAMDAARSARFRPARDSAGNPATARVQLRVTLDRSAPPPVSIEGVVQAAGSAQTLPHITLEAVAEDGRALVATTDDQGRFAFVGLPEGLWILTASGRGVRPTTLAVTVRAGVVQSIELRLVPDALYDIDAVGAEVVVRRPQQESIVQERTLPTDLARVLPGTNGDVVKVVQSLPGVARAPMGTGNLIIRGTAPRDSGGFLDGTPLPMVFHFGGLSTVIPSRAVAEVTYIPGNAGVRYGRILGGVVDIATRDARPEHPERAVHVDLFQAGVFLDTPVGERSAVTVSGRRSYVDTVLQSALDSRGVPVRAPVFADTQARWLRVADDGTRTEVLFLYSQDSFEYIGIEDGEPAAAIDLDLSFWRLRGRVLQKVGAFSHELTLAVGVDHQKFDSFSWDNAFEQTASVNVREEWFRPVRAAQLGLRLGFDLWSGREVFVYDVETFGPFEGGATPFFAPALYGEVSAKWGKLTTTPGLRGDLVVYPYDAVAGSLDPRLHLRYDLDDVWAILVAAGTYSRLPSARQIASSTDGNTGLLAERSWQNSVGVEILPYDGVRFELTGYANFLDRRIVGHEDRFEFQATQLLTTGPETDTPYANSGTGTIFGGELLARLDRTRFTGWIAATVSRSRRVDAPGATPSLFAYDQPFVITALGTTPLPRNWRLGSRIRFTSGNPYTPVVNRFQDLESRTFVPVYGTLDSERLQPFVALDLRVDKTFVFEHWRLTTSLDVQNITPRPNPELAGWNSTYTEFEPVTGLPPIPVFGLEGQW
jgi:hypothetical protein